MVPIASIAVLLLMLSGCAMSLQDFQRLSESIEARNGRARADAEAALFAREGLERFSAPSLSADLTRESLRRCELWEHGQTRGGVPALQLREGEAVLTRDERVIVVVQDGSTNLSVTAGLEPGCSFFLGSTLVEVTTFTGEVHELMRRPGLLARERSGGLVAYELIPRVVTSRRVKVGQVCEESMPQPRASVFVRPPGTGVLWKEPVRRVAATYEVVELNGPCGAP